MARQDDFDYMLEQLGLSGGPTQEDRYATEQASMPKTPDSGALASAGPSLVPIVGPAPVIPMPSVEPARAVASEPAAADENEEASPAAVLAKYNNLKANPTPNARPLGDTLAALLGKSRDELSNAQSDRNSLQLMSMLGQAGSTIGNALTPLAAKQDSSAFWNQMNNAAQQPITDLKTKEDMAQGALKNQLLVGEAQTAMDKNNPTSAVSMAAKEFYKKTTGKDADVRLSAADLEKMDPILARMFTQGENAKNRAIMSQNLTTHKNSKEASDLAQKMSKALDSDVASSRTALGRAANKKQSAAAIEALVSAYADPNNIDVRQTQEIAKSLDAMISGGAGSVSGTEHLIPKTYAGSWAKVVEWISSNPHGANQGEFIKRMMDTVGREKSLAQAQLVEYGKQKIPAFKRLRELDKDQYNEILKSHGLDEDSLAATSVPQSEHDKAVAWAKANPTDPRSAQILQANGVK